jgi:hypothetical protein
VDELIARAKNKKAIIDAMKEQPEAPSGDSTGDQG